MSGALKTMFVFSLRQDPCRNRSYAAGGARYLHADLMLLTHAGCAFKDPHGCFGISGPGAPRRLHGAEGRGMKSGKPHLGGGLSFQPHRLHRVDDLFSFALLHCAGTASAGQLLLFLLRELGAAASVIRDLQGGKLTCTARPDGSGARSGRLQLPGCERTAPSHGRGMHESGGCNGSRLPAVPDTCRCPRPWRSE